MIHGPAGIDRSRLLALLTVMASYILFSHTWTIKQNWVYDKLIWPNSAKGIQQLRDQSVQGWGWGRLCRTGCTSICLSASWLFWNDHAPCPPEVKKTTTPATDAEVSPRSPELPPAGTQSVDIRLRVDWFDTEGYNTCTRGDTHAPSRARGS
jgi:hypothetical protein